MGTSWSCSVNISKYIFREKEIQASVLKMFHFYISVSFDGGRQRTGSNYMFCSFTVQIMLSCGTIIVKLTCTCP